MAAIIEAVPILVGAGAGLAIGGTAEAYMQQRIAERRTNVNEVMGEVNAEVTAGDATLQERLKDTGKKCLGPIALAATLAGAVNGYAWFNSPAAKPNDAAIQLVVDRSGATDISSSDETTPAKTISEVMAAFKERDDLDVTAHVARLDDVTTMDLTTAINSSKPRGDAPMAQAFSRADQQIDLNNRDNPEPSENNTTVVLTWGNNIGRSANAVKMAADSNNTVHTVNFNSEATKDVKASLKKTNRLTGGKYYDIETTTPEQIAEAVAGAAVDKPEATKRDSRKSEKIIGIFLAGLCLAQVPYRKNMAIRPGGTDIKETS